MNEIQNSDPSTLDEKLQEPAPNSKFGVQRSMFDVFPFLRWLKNVFDYVGGSREEPPAGFPSLASSWWLGLWWGLLAGLILLFCGQTSKFIYIDF
jgi:hypothetical protein